MDRHTSRPVLTLLHGELEAEAKHLVELGLRTFPARRFDGREVSGVPEMARTRVCGIALLSHHFPTVADREQLVSGG